LGRIDGVALTTMTKKDYINTLPPKEKSKEKSGANEYKGMRTEKGKNRQDKKVLFCVVVNVVDRMCRSAAQE
jgi:hypothetical protein